MTVRCSLIALSITFYYYKGWGVGKTVALSRQETKTEPCDKHVTDTHSYPDLHSV